MSDTLSEVTTALALYPALAEGDRAALDALLSPDFVGRTTAALPLGLGGEYVGARAMRREFWGQIAKHYEMHADPAEAESIGSGRVVVRGTYRGMGRATGRKLEAEFVHTVTVADGRIVALDQLTDSAAWAAALVPEAPAISSERPPLRSIELDLSGPVGRFRLARPEAGNAIDPVLAQDLLTAAQNVAAAGNLRVLVISADGPAFSPGGDLAALSSTPQTELPALLDEMLTAYHQALRILTDLPVPIVAAVHGSAGGGSLGLLHVADFVVAGERAKFAVGSGALALGSDGGNTWFLPQLVGRRVAAQMCYLNRVLTAAEALELGLVTEIADDVPARAAEIAEKLAAGSRRSNAKLRELLRPGRTLSDALDAERDGMVTLSASPDVVEAMHAFLERRPARFEDV
ncbi:MAG: enoyl-CoA hydratase-related protein [Sporichthyaceae bacterium]